MGSFIDFSSLLLASLCTLCSTMTFINSSSLSRADSLIFFLFLSYFCSYTFLSLHLHCRVSCTFWHFPLLARLFTAVNHWTEFLSLCCAIFNFSALYQKIHLQYSRATCVRAGTWRSRVSCWWFRWASCLRSSPRTRTWWRYLGWDLRWDEIGVNFQLSYFRRQLTHPHTVANF